MNSRALSNACAASALVRLFGAAGTYRWRLHHFEGLGETQLVLQTPRETARDGGFSSSGLFPNSYLYSPNANLEWRFQPSAAGGYALLRCGARGMASPLRRFSASWCLSVLLFVAAFSQRARERSMRRLIQFVTGSFTPSGECR